MRETPNLVRSTRSMLAASVAWTLLASCSRSNGGIPIQTEFEAWNAPDGTIHWQLTVPADTWQVLSRGERFDFDHQHPSQRSIGIVSGVIDASLQRHHLCPGAWAMIEVRHYPKGYTFKGACDVPLGRRT